MYKPGDEVAGNGCLFVGRSRDWDGCTRFWGCVCVLEWVLWEWRWTLLELILSVDPFRVVPLMHVLGGRICFWICREVEGCCNISQHQSMGE
jgi:hypothetical protein